MGGGADRKKDDRWVTVERKMSDAERVNEGGRRKRQKKKKKKEKEEKDNGRSKSIL